ncbi:MAG TPA: stage V sporulation protein AD, partial [Clostridiales bacterium]|nr:stage V sporulation protein AD [Clostridiales bacterium]
TATAGGAFLLSRGEYSAKGVKILGGMAGKVINGGISDAANMGAAMAPAAADTIVSYFEKTGKSPSDFDAIVTGDLGKLGSELLLELTAGAGISIEGVHRDCGNMLYDANLQDIHCGGSGCGCSASVLSAYFLPRLAAGEMKNILFLSTGALMSPSSVQQGDEILGVAPLIRISSL